MKDDDLLRMLVHRSTRETVLRLGVWAVSLDDGPVARLLAGLEVALAAALREAGRGRCLKCGHEWETAIWVQPWDICHCDYCGGILSPLPARVEG